MCIGSTDERLKQWVRLKRLGLKGGLKSIEQQLGMDRSEETSGLSGWDAVRLWNLWQAGNEDAGEVLMRYNREDVVNMEYLLQWAYPRMEDMITSYP